jgi:hypothetical protein
MAGQHKVRWKSFSVSSDALIQGFRGFARKVINPDNHVNPLKHAHRAKAGNGIFYRITGLAWIYMILRNNVSPLNWDSESIPSNFLVIHPKF